MRMFKVTACVPSQTRIRTQRELQNTYFTKLVPYEKWVARLLKWNWQPVSRAQTLVWAKGRQFFSKLSKRSLANHQVAIG
jgi:hypothetical protein